MRRLLRWLSPTYLIPRLAFNKWKNVCLRHVEDLSLMESHLDIKRAGATVFLLARSVI